MDRLLLIDGHSVAYRAFFALPVENFSTTTGQSTNAVFGFTSMLINVLRDEKPTHVAVAFDVSRKTFRLEQYAEYKGNRSKSPPEFTGQIPLIKEILDALHITTFEKDGFEADDIIGTLTTRAESAGMEVLICTGDRDALQLVTDKTTVLYPRKGVSDLARMTPAAVQDKYAVTPDHYPDIAALVGETSDNLPGVPGVGPKTAAKWINQYGTLEAIVDDVDNDPRQGGRVDARAPRQRAAQPQHQRADPRPRPAGGTGRPRVRHGVGPRGDPHGVRRAGVQRAAGQAVRGVRRRGAPGRGGLRPRGHDPARPARSPRGSRRSPSQARASVSTCRARGVAARATSSAWRSPRTSRRRGSAPTTSPPTTTRPSRRGSPTPTGPRSCTMPRGRRWRSRPRAGRSRAWRPTRRCRRTSSGPTSGRTTWATCRCATSSVSCATSPTTPAS